MANKRAFTLIELLIVVGVIALLLGIAMPMLLSAREQSMRASCAANLRNVHMGAQTIAVDQRSVLPAALDGEVQVAFDSATAAQWESVEMPGPDASDGPTQTQNWQCPSSEYLPYTTEDEGELWVGYQYMGGIQTWENDQGTFDAQSPVRVDQARSTWVLAADGPMHYEGEGWDEDRLAHAARDGVPVGQNQVYMDGSASWVDRTELMFVHSGLWDEEDAAFFMKQDDLGTEIEPAGLYYMSDAQYRPE